jgi:Dolichyl-phosphate-mannose-protein mannosyltransferase
VSNDHRGTPRPGTGSRLGWAIVALVVGALASLAGWLDHKYAWISPAFDAVAHQFFEVPLLAGLRRPSQLVLVRWHLAAGTGMFVLGLLLAPFFSRHARTWLAVFGIGYGVRAIIWICGGNLPLVPGDSCHYLEVATSVLRGEGPVKHYVESFFIDYPRIRSGEGVLDDWATPLDAYVRAAAFWIAGLRPDDPIDGFLAVAKACSFVLNLLAMPVLYLFARRQYGPSVALWSMAALAVLPVHAIYAGFILRESLVALFSILAVWTLTEVYRGDGRSAWSWLWGALAGVCGGLAVLARTTAFALLGAAGVFSLAFHGRRRFGQLLLWAALIVVVILPWGWATMKEYGRPFFTYTDFFEYNFSWAVHHFDRGNTLASQFYTGTNLPQIVRVKLKSLLIIAVHSTMIMGLPMVLGFLRQLSKRGLAAPGRIEVLIALMLMAFVLGTLKRTADVTQVEQLGRYYLPVFALMLPTAVAGVFDWWESRRIRRRLLPWAAATYCALVWSGPTWAYDASWLVKPYQLHWPALRETADWIRAHPESVSPRAQIMTWFPWELRVLSQRTTVLMPRSYNPRRIQDVMRQYGVTHFLWGSFEPPPFAEINPESWGLELEQLRATLGLTEARELHRSSKTSFFPVRLYRLQ